MYKFTIEYYYSRYHTGNLNTTKTRKAVVTAANRDEAFKKLVRVDCSVISIANLEFEEVPMAEVVHGRWVVENEASIRCSECCFNRSSIKMPLDYCPICGAKMDAKEDINHATG